MKVSKLLPFLFVAPFFVACSDDDDAKAVYQKETFTNKIWTNNLTPTVGYYFSSEGNVFEEFQHVGKSSEYVSASGTWKVENDAVFVTTTDADITEFFKGGNKISSLSSEELKFGAGGASTFSAKKVSISNTLKYLTYYTGWRQVSIVKDGETTNLQKNPIIFGTSGKSLTTIELSNNNNQVSTSTWSLDAEEKVITIKPNDPEEKTDTRRIKSINATKMVLEVIVDGKVAGEINYDLYIAKK